MSTDSKNTTEVINQIASDVVMMQPDDIQMLGDILKKVNSLEAEHLQEYITQVADIVEQLILDEYESPDVGLEDLNAAIEQLQIAADTHEHIPTEQQESKKEITDGSAASSETPSNGQKIKLEEKENKEDSPQSIETDKSASDSDSDSEDDNQKSKDSTETTEPGIKEEKGGKEKDTAADTDTDIDTDGEKETQTTDKEVETDDTDTDIEEDLEEIDDIFEESDDPDVINRVLEEDPELVEGFIQESQENLQLIENGMLQLESSPDDLELIDEIFRPFHTIKGVAGFLNLNDINALSHSYENLLDDARNGELKITDDVAQVVLEGVDALRMMTNTLAESQQKEEYIPHELNLDYYANLIKQARAKKADTIEVKADSDEKSSGQKSKKSKSSSPGGRGGRKPSDMQSPGGGGFENVETSVRVNTDKMDSLLDLVGELVVTQNMVMQNTEIQNSSDKRLQQDIGQLKRITSSLQDLSMSLRMVPIKGTFQKMHRIVRDLSRKKDKKIVLEIHGEETEIDRNMVDELYEPLVHMIRNNCDHGIETPEERVAAGKPETGKLSLNAYYKGGMVVIEVADDGQGIDVEKIRNLAIERNVIDPEHDLSESQILNLIFTSGFSTTENVTDVSGRGVGMDVVKKAINNMRGSIDIKTKKGKGTSFSLKLPLTLAIIDGVVVRIGSERFIIPTTAIKESLKLEQGNYNKIAGKGETLYIRDRVVPLLRIDDFFGIDDAVRDPKEGVVMVIESESKEAAILVDEMLDKQEIVIKSLGEGLNKIRGLSGGAIMPDGTVGLIVDVPTLLPKTKMSFEKAD